VTADAKAAARKAALAARKSAKATVDQAAARENLAALLAGHEGRPLAGYMPIRTEIDPLPVMAAWSGPVGVPVIEGEGLPLSFARWTRDTELVEGAFGAAIPRAPMPVIPEVLIVPLLAFSAAGYRLGYGGGFYDRTLEGLRARGPVFAVGFAFEAQRMDDLPLEPTDQPLDAIVTETVVRRFG
jgi:5-formyltetrahydrofolate cyclo-ligase